MPADTVTISVEEYNEMKDRLAWLDALEAAGVDNWSGFDSAGELYTDRQED